MTGRRLLLWLLWGTGAARAARAALVRDGRFVVELHGVAGRRWDLPGGEVPFTSSDLEAVLGWLADRFPMLTPGELLAGEGPGVLLTFDDGLANNVAHALPILEAFSAPAVFFVSTRHVLEPRDWLPASRRRARELWGGEDRVPEEVARDLFDGMSREQLRSCAEHPLITVGSHTVGHPYLTRCDDGTLRRELERSKRQLEQWCGRPVDLFAYPAGDYDPRVVRAVCDAGYRAAFAEDAIGLGAAGIGSPAYEIPRVGLYGSDPAYLAVKLSGLHRRALPPAPIMGSGLEVRDA